MQVRTHQNDTIDQLCWRHLGQTERVVEATLEESVGHKKLLDPVLYEVARTFFE